MKKVITRIKLAYVRHKIERKRKALYDTIMKEHKVIAKFIQDNPRVDSKLLSNLEFSIRKLSRKSIVNEVAEHPPREAQSEEALKEARNLVGKHYAYNPIELLKQEIGELQEKEQSLRLSLGSVKRRPYYSLEIEEPAISQEPKKGVVIR